MQYYIIGAGLTGLSAARTLAEQGNHVTVFEKSKVLGGNVRELEIEGSLVHEHGPHFFHANSSKVISFVKRFASWLPYEHVVAARTLSGVQVRLPICSSSVQQLSPANADSILSGLRNELGTRAESTILALMESDSLEVREFGRFVFKTFYEGYSEKQWGFNPFQLDRSVLSRVPVRVTDDDRYFTDEFQAIPKNGYNDFVENLAAHEKIRIEFETSPTLDDFSREDKVISTAPLDEVLNFEFGPLPYRSLNFRFEREVDVEEEFDHVQTNFSNTQEYTRVVNYRLFYELLGAGRSDLLAYEYSEDFEIGKNHRYYPILTEQSKIAYKEYLDLLGFKFPNVATAGRLGDFKYYNMDQAIARGMQIANLVAT